MSTPLGRLRAGVGQRDGDCVLRVNAVRPVGPVVREVPPRDCVLDPWIAWADQVLTNTDVPVSLVAAICGSVPSDHDPSAGDRSHAHGLLPDPDQEPG